MKTLISVLAAVVLVPVAVFAGGGHDRDYDKCEPKIEYREKIVEKPVEKIVTRIEERVVYEDRIVYRDRPVVEEKIVYQDRIVYRDIPTKCPTPEPVKCETVPLKTIPNTGYDPSFWEYLVSWFK